MTKIIGLTIAALMIMSIIGYATWSYWADPEFSPDNTIYMGTLDLSLNGDDADVTILAGLNNVAPNTNGANSATLKNIGSLTGDLKIATAAVSNVGGSGGSEYEDGVGHLGAAVTIAMWLDVDESADWSSGDIGLMSNATLYYFPTALQYDIFNNYGSKTWGASPAIKQYTENEQDAFYISWQCPDAGNTIQGDRVSVNITFTLTQS